MSWGLVGRRCGHWCKMLTPKRFLQGYAYYLSEADFERELSKLRYLLMEYVALGALGGTLFSLVFYVIMYFIRRIG